ncbi:MAG: hypothetical protein AB7I18_07845 [Candidatus Berkiella sp.]
MKQLTMGEISIVSGAEYHHVMMVDLIAASLFLSFASEETFRSGAVVTGMAGGSVAGAYWGYVALGGNLAGGVGALAAGALGAVAGGLVCKVVGNFMVASYNWIIT